MNKRKIALIIITLIIASNTYAKDIILPAVASKVGMDITQAIEIRTASRSYDGSEVSLDAISYMFWAGNGITLTSGNKTIHGYDAVSGATSRNRYTVPTGWGTQYIKLYLLLENGGYEYIPKEHKLKFIADKKSVSDINSSGYGAYGIIVIAADFSKMPGGNSGMTRDVAFMSGGSAAQNMYIAGSVYDIQMLTEVYFAGSKIKSALKLSKDIEPLAILSFGHAK